MKGHPGGEAHTRRMLELAGLPEGARVLDMGAGAGEALAILREYGFEARDGAWTKYIGYDEAYRARRFAAAYSDLD